MKQMGKMQEKFKGKKMPSGPAGLAALRGGFR